MKLVLHLIFLILIMKFIWFFIQLSVHQNTGQLRIGYLNFQGKRSNIFMFKENIIPPFDYDGSFKPNKAVAPFGIVLNLDEPAKCKRFYIYRHNFHILDKDKFNELFGFVW